MDYTERLTLSYYKTIAVLNEAHQVFLVQHRQTDQICVKKVLSIYNPEIFRFLREHPIPGTPRIRALWEEEGMLTVLEEYISGITLEERMRNAPLTPEEVLSYFSELCDIAERLHQCKPPIIHRDIKPSNIMLTSCGHLVLLDFNAAKSFHRPAAADTTRLGTQGYAAPEQYGFGASSPQTDLYAMGVLLREMSQSFADTAAGRHFLAIAARCTRLNPDERFASAEELKQALTSPLQEPEKQQDAAPLKKSSGKRSLLPPGFRSCTPWKMFLAFLGYILVFAIALTLEVKDASGALLWLNRLFCLGLLLTLIAANLQLPGNAASDSSVPEPSASDPDTGSFPAGCVDHLHCIYTAGTTHRTVYFINQFPAKKDFPAKVFFCKYPLLLLV